MPGSNAPFHKYKMEKTCCSSSCSEIYFTGLGPVPWLPTAAPCTLL